MERYFLQVLYDMFQIPMACWDGEASFVQPSSAQPDAPVLGDEKLRGELENICCRNAFGIQGEAVPALARCPSKK